MNKTLQLINLKTRTAMNAKISVSVICVEAIIYLLLYNLHDCTFKYCIKILLCVQNLAFGGVWQDKCSANLKRQLE